MTTPTIAPMNQIAADLGLRIEDAINITPVRNPITFVINRSEKGGVIRLDASSTRQRKVFDAVFDAIHGNKYDIMLELYSWSGGKMVYWKTLEFSASKEWVDEFIASASIEWAQAQHR